MVRTEPSQGLNTGSTPVSATKFSIAYRQCAHTRSHALWPSRSATVLLLEFFPFSSCLLISPLDSMGIDRSRHIHRTVPQPLRYGRQLHPGGQEVGTMGMAQRVQTGAFRQRSEERRVGKEWRSR